MTKGLSWPHPPEGFENQVVLTALGLSLKKQKTFFKQFALSA